MHHTFFFLLCFPLCCNFLIKSAYEPKDTRQINQIRLMHYWSSNCDQHWIKIIMYDENKRGVFAINSPSSELVCLSTLNLNSDEHYLYEESANLGVICSKKLLPFSEIKNHFSDFNESIPQNIHIPIPLSALAIQKGYSVLDFLVKQNLLSLDEALSADEHGQKNTAQIIESLSLNFTFDYLKAAENLCKILMLNIHNIDVATCCTFAIPLRITRIVKNLGFIGNKLLFGRPKKSIDFTVKKEFENICNEYKSITQAYPFFDIGKYFASRQDWNFWLYADPHAHFVRLFRHILYEEIKTKRDIISIDEIIQTLKKLIEEKIKSLENRIFPEEKSLQSNQNFTVQLHGEGLGSGAYSTCFYSLHYYLKTKPHSLPLFTTVNLIDDSSIKSNSIPIIVQQLENEHLVLFDCRDMVEDEGIPIEGPKLCKPLAVIDKNVSKKEHLACIGKVFSITDVCDIITTFEVIECADEESKYSGFNYHPLHPTEIKKHIRQTLCGGFYPKEMKRRDAKPTSLLLAIKNLILEKKEQSKPEEIEPVAIEKQPNEQITSDKEISSNEENFRCQKD